VKFQPFFRPGGATRRALAFNPASLVLDLLAVAIVVFVIYKLLLGPLWLRPPVVRAPPFSLPALDRGRISVFSRPGRVVFLDFWASWCPPCRQSLPLVERFARAHPDVEVVAVDVGESAAAAGSFARAHGVANVALDGDKRVSDAYGAVVLPTIVAIDPAGYQRGRWTGYNPAIELALEHARETLVPKLKTSSAGTSWLAPASAAEARALTIAVDEDPSSLNTVLNTPYGWLLGPLTQGYLFLVDARGRLVPDRALAIPTRANGGVSSDGRTIAYRIRTGRWSDGAPFDARDVAFTVAALRNPATDVPDRSTVDQIERIEVPRPDRVVVHLRAPSAPFVSAFLTLGANDPYAVLPRHVAAGLRDLNASSLDAQPVGLGPFRLSVWRRGDRLEFERNPYYWRGPPGVPRVVALVSPNAGTRLLQVRAGDLDAAYVSGLLLDEARRSGLPVTVATTNIVDYLQFNLRRRPLGELRVRRALAQALDRERLAQTVYRGLEAPTDTGQLDPALGHAGSLPRYDPLAAAAQLAPRHLQLELAIAGSWRSSSAAAVQLAAQLARAGVRTTIHSYSPAQFWGPKSAGGILAQGKFDIALTSWSPGLDPDRSYLFGCDALPPAGGNAGGYCDRAFDAAEAAGMRTYDPRERVAAYRRAHAILAADLPIVPLGFERSAYARNVRLEGLEPNVLGRDYWNAWAWKLRSR
jgi:peptide/nickel transport system substrate-binding protein